jgi:serine/threonine-protein kinase RsbW
MPLDHAAWSVKMHLPSDMAARLPVLEEVAARMHEQDWSHHEIYGVQLSLEEALSNAIRHGNRLDRAKRVRFSCEMSRRRIRIEVADEGSGFKPSEVPDCTAEANLEKPGGRGLLLMQFYMSRVEYNRAGNVVVMEKEREVQAKGGSDPEFS